MIKTTRSHLFWNQTSHRWAKAGALKYGTHLRTPSASSATVLGGWTPKVTTGWMWDLTIPTDHDFYIQATTNAVLVHNVNEGTPGSCGDAGPSGTNSAETLRSAVNQRALEVIDGQSNKARGPVLTGAMDRQTCDVFFGQNTGIPEPLHPDLQGNLDNFEGEGAPFRGIPGAHSEINALNQGLFARPGAQLGDFLLYSVRLQRSRALEQIPMCENCAQIVGDASDLP